MKHIYIDTQAAWDYFIDNVAPYTPDFHDDDQLVEAQEWFDAWVFWLVGDECTDGNDIDYEYPDTPEARNRLDVFGIKYEVR